MECSLNLTCFCATSDCFNVGSWFVLICLPEDCRNGNALYCHWPKTEHHRLMKKKEVRSQLCKYKLSSCNNNTIMKPQSIFYVISGISWTESNINSILPTGLLHSGRQAWHVHPAPVCREDCALPCNPKKHNPQCHKNNNNLWTSQVTHNMLTGPLH